MVSTNLLRVFDHMKFYGLNPRSSKDRRQYAFLLYNDEIDEPRQLRGMKKDKASGFCWSRKEAFIAKNKHGLDYLKMLPYISELLNNPFCRVSLSSTHKKYITSWKGKPCVVSITTLAGGVRQISVGDWRTT